MGTTKIAVTKHLLHEALLLPPGVEIVGTSECPFDHSVDIIVRGETVPDADRCQVTVYREATQYEFRPVEERKP